MLQSRKKENTSYSPLHLMIHRPGGKRIFLSDIGIDVVNVSFFVLRYG